MSLVDAQYWQVCRSPAAHEVLVGRMAQIGDRYVTDDDKPHVFDGRRAALPVGAVWIPDLDYLMHAVCYELGMVKWGTAFMKLMGWMIKDNPADKFGASLPEVLLRYLIYLRTGGGMGAEGTLPSLSRDRTLLERETP